MPVQKFSGCHDSRHLDHQEQSTQYGHDALTCSDAPAEPQNSAVRGGASRYYNSKLLYSAAWLRDLTLRPGQDCGMLAVMEDTRVQASDAHAAWSESFNELFARVAGDFSNAKVRRHGRAYLLGLLSQAERKTSWQRRSSPGTLAGRAAAAAELLPRDEDACRDALCRYVTGELGDPAAVLAPDETGFLKRGRNADVGITSLMTSLRLCRGGCCPPCSVAVCRAVARHYFPCSAALLVASGVWSVPTDQTGDSHGCSR